jgi:hypothetical protein
MAELMVPEMKTAMRRIGDVMLGELKGAGFSLAMIAEMGEKGALVEARRFDAEECSTVRVFMDSARKRIRERVREGACVVLVGITVLLHERGPSIQGGGCLEEERRRFTEAGVEVLSGTAVFGINRRETMAEVYSKTGALAEKIRVQSGDNLNKTLRMVSTYLFEGVPWPTMN